MLPRSLALILLLACSTAASAQTWRMTDLGSLGGPHSCANAINNKGDIVGVSTLKGDKFSHAVLWSKDKMTDLGTLDGFPSSDAIGISDAGAIVGEAWVPYQSTEKKRAVTWNANKASVLGVARSDAQGAAAYRVNDGGLAVGRAYLADPGTRSGARAVLLDKGNVALVPAFDLPDNAGRVTPEVAMGVNKGGTVVGAGRLAIGEKGLRRPFVYKNGAAIDPLYAFDHVNPAWANDVNDAGDVVILRVITKTGEADAKGTWQSLIVKNGKVTEVPPLDGLANAELRSINARGDAVGYSWNPTGGTIPMIYTKGVSIDPNKALTESSKWKIVLLTDINDAGQVIGVASNGDETHAIRLDPVGNSQVALDGDPDAPVMTQTWTTAFAGPRPNPATSAMGAQFAFTLARQGSVTIQLTNVQGRIVRTLTGDFDAGPSALLWDGRDDNGARVGSGVFFARFTGLGVAATRKVVIAD